MGVRGVMSGERGGDVARATVRKKVDGGRKMKAEVGWKSLQE